MGQYWIFVILDETGKLVRAYVKPGTIRISANCKYGHGSKLTEHTSFDSTMVLAVEELLAPKGMFYRSRVVWAGDYADPEPRPTESTESAPEGASEARNLYNIVSEQIEEDDEKTTQGKLLNSRMLVPNPGETHRRFVVNHTKKMYVDVERVGEKPEICYNDCRIHPLPLLVAEGNDRGGGDYGAHSADYELVGTWARDVISVDDILPAGFEELVCNFWD